MNGQQVLITGLGVVAPTGVGADAHWQAVLAGKSGIARITRFDPTAYPVRIAGEVKEFDAAERVPRKVIPETDRWTHLALVAADEALQDAGVDLSVMPEFDVAVVTSSSSGGTDFGQHQMEQLYQNGPSWVGVYQSIAWFYAATTGQLSIRHGLRGPCGVLCGEQAGGLDAIGQARRLLSSGTRLVVSGGTDASLCPYGLVAQLSSGELSTVDDPAGAYLPFDAEASGHVPGEGGAIVITETADAARERGHEAYAGVLGYAAGFDPRPGSGRPPALKRVIERALQDANLTPADVDVVFADAAGVPQRDLDEAQAIGAIFGPRGVAVTAPKTLTGRLYGGGAALDVATAALALRHGVIPPTTGPTRLAPGIELDLVTAPREPARLRTALVLARGHGGFTAALLLGRQ
ncbi:ketosynthase chain-length factor [Kutzneria chonburiensis]|uniref:Ketosynthase chain-length factor n=1 Tax=Kutzneria chonburiensis TaxID=1483604 RepID=A0ABV6MRB6_9PSEU|nr:ketosynthase chain-length factor [Kutzneria chonburiensis]